MFYIIGVESSNPSFECRNSSSFFFLYIPDTINEYEMHTGKYE